MLGKGIVNVLRDAECTGVIVKQPLVPEGAFKGNVHTCMMVYRSTLELHEAKVYLDTPYFKGKTLALCKKNPLVEVILGNVLGARDAQSPDINWVLALVVQTRAPAEQIEKSKSQLRTPSIVDSDTTPDQIRASQVSDPTLARDHTACEEQIIKGNAFILRRET